MMIPDELTPRDYEILQYVSKFSSIPEEKILDHFSSDRTATKVRIDLLSTADRIGAYELVPYSSCLDRIYKYSRGDPTYTGNIKINDFGRKVLQDWKLKEKSALRQKLITYGTFAASLISAVAALLK